MAHVEAPDSSTESLVAPPWRSEPPPWGLADLVALIIWTAAVVAFFWNAVSGRGAMFYFDVSELNLPYRDFLASQLRQGKFGRWFPGLYCGLPLYSESQAGYLHPLKYLLYPWLPTWHAFSLDTVGSVWLTGLGTYGWLRRHVGSRGALTGAAIFALSGFEWAHLIHTSMVNALSSVPLVIWATEWAWDRRRTAGIALGAIALACQVFAGHLQDTLLTAALLGLYTVYRAVTETNWRPRLHVIATASTVVALGVALAAVQWIPSKELLDRSPRAGGLTWEKLTYGSWHPELLPTLVVRESYGTRARDTDWMDGFYPYHEMNAYLGLAAIALAVVGAAASRDRWVAFWILAAGVGSMLMLGKFTFIFDHAHRIPIAGSSRIPVRFHLWVSLAVAALASVGVDRLERGFPVRLRLPLIVIGLMVVLSIPIMLSVYSPVFTDPNRWNTAYHLARFRWLGRELVIGSVRTTVLTSVAIAAMACSVRTTSERSRRRLCWLFPLVVISDLFGSHWYDAPTVAPSFWTEPPLSALKIREDPGFSRVFGIAEKSSGEPGYASEPVDFFSVRDTLDWSLPPVWGLKTSRGETPLISKRLLTYTDNARVGAGRFEIESVSHLVGGKLFKPEFMAALDLEPPEKVGKAYIYRVPSRLPRARLAGRPVYVSDEAAAGAAIFKLGPELRERLVVEDPTTPLPAGANPVGTARIAVDESERVVVETESKDPAYLVLSDTFDPGWTATVDGKPAPIRPAYSAFRAVFLPPGKHSVEFRYTPKGFATGLAISGAGLVLAVVLLVWPRPLPETRPTHDLLGWPARWPVWGLVVAVSVVAGSAVYVGPGGRPGVHPRWADGFHKFTWGAGIEAMRKAPKG